MEAKIEMVLMPKNAVLDTAYNLHILCQIMSKHIHQLDEEELKKVVYVMKGMDRTIELINQVKNNPNDIR